MGLLGDPARRAIFELPAWLDRVRDDALTAFHKAAEAAPTTWMAAWPNSAA